MITLSMRKGIVGSDRWVWAAKTLHCYHLVTIKTARRNAVFCGIGEAEAGWSMMREKIPSG
jgi:hypothetical protein